MARTAVQDAMNANAPSPDAAGLADSLAELLVNGAPMGEVFGYTERDYELVYALGHSLYAQARYDDAARVLGFLVMHNHLERRFVSAYACALQMAGRHQDAISFHSLASTMDLSDPVPTFHTAECMLALGWVDEARQALGMALRQCDAPERQALKARAQAMLDLMGRATTGKAQP